MGTTQISLLGLGGLVVVFILFIVIRTILFKPKKSKTALASEVKFDHDRAIYTLQELIKLKTISYKDEAKEDYEEFLKLEEQVKILFPLVNKVCKFTKVSKKSLVFYWKGLEQTKEPIVLMSHYDVVPVEEELWDVDPFSGLIKDGYLWGRGTLDTKGTLNAVLSSVENLIKEDFVPKKDIYLCFSGNEETLGYGAPDIVTWFEKQGISPSLVLDEGGAVVDNVFPGVKKDCALIGIAEKGAVEIQLTLKSSGGHASAPKAHTNIGELAKACVKIENKPLPRNLTKPVRLMFDTLGRHSNFLYRMIFANLWLFSGLLDKVNKKQGGELNALMRTTIAFTQMEGSSANNVIPPVAKLGINSRTMAGETSDSTVEYLKKVIDNPDIQITKHNPNEPSRISEVDAWGYKKVENAVFETWGDLIVSPYLMFAASDSRHYGRISPYVYRFSPMKLTKEDRNTIHGNNEKIKLENIIKSVEFYIRLIQGLNK